VTSDLKIIRYSRLHDHDLSPSIMNIHTEQVIQRSCRPGVNFINVFYVRIFHMNVVLANFSSYVLAPKFRTKKARVNVDEIDGRLNYLCNMKMEQLT